MKNILLSSFLVLLLMILSCGESDLEKGQRAFTEGNYLDAVKFLSLAYEQDVIGIDQHEMLALAYLYRGYELYKKTRNIKAFYGNIDKAKSYFPEIPSENFNKEYSKILVSLGQAYQKAKPKSDTDKTKFFNQAILSFKTALEYDSTNVEAIALMEQLKSDHFQKLLDKAKSLYEKGRKTRNTELYFTSEYYVNQAAQFDDSHPEVRELISKIRQNQLSLLDYKQGLAIAVNDYLYKDKFFTIHLTMRNYTQKSIRINLNNFELIDVRGNKYHVDKKEIEGRKLFGDICIEDTILTTKNSFIDGIVVFSVPEKVYMRQLTYKMSVNEIKRKYFR